MGCAVLASKTSIDMGVEQRPNERTGVTLPNQNAYDSSGTPNLSAKASIMTSVMVTPCSFECATHHCRQLRGTLMHKLACFSSVVSREDVDFCICLLIGMVVKTASGNTNPLWSYLR